MLHFIARWTKCAQLRLFGIHKTIFIRGALHIHVFVKGRIKSYRHFACMQVLRPSRFVYFVSCQICIDVPALPIKRAANKPYLSLVFFHK